jgi:hypothetical protein
LADIINKPHYLRRKAKESHARRSQVAREWIWQSRFKYVFLYSYELKTGKLQFNNLIKIIPIDRLPISGGTFVVQERVENNSSIRYLNSSHYHQYHKDDQYQPESSARPISPCHTMRPDWKYAYKNQNQKHH